VVAARGNVLVSSSARLSDGERLVIANGYGKFALAGLAAELTRIGLDPRLITGVQPPRSAGAAALLARSDSGRRLLQRAEDAPDLDVKSAWAGETLYQVGRVLAARRITAPAAGRAFAGAMGLFAVEARMYTRDVGRGLYHFRAGYGGARHLARLRASGAGLLCDHSIAHPRALVALVDGGGVLPPCLPQGRLDPVNARIERDLTTADRILVNSDFVKATCVAAGVAPDRVDVVYWGVEDDILDALDNGPRRDEPARGRPLRVLHAGRMERRKGTPVVAAALDMLDPGTVETTFVGAWDPSLSDLRRRLENMPGVAVRGHVDRLELTRLMTTFDVFVFPSLAEGSARVVGQAMAAGCAVVVTPNAGSFMRPDVDGLVVPPGDAGAVAAAITSFARRPAEAAAAGRAAAARVRTDFRYSDYARRITPVYDSLRATLRSGAGR
jgi:glycosyltransferase involved in cell wall biosynthesis